MSNKFAAALSNKTQSATPAPAVAEKQDGDATPRYSRPSRKSTKFVGGHFDPVVSKQLRQIALSEDSTVQALVAEALDMLFQSRQMPTIASKPKE